MTGLLAAAPALPLHSAGKYVAGAYVVFLVLVLIYVAIMATRLSRTERDLVELQRDLQAHEDARAREQEHEAEPVGAGGLARPGDGERGWRAGA